MAGYGQDSIDYIDDHREAMPSILEILMMCRELGIKKDDFRTVSIESAWEYYYELRALLEKQEAEKRTVEGR